jgi:hypothetical protein
MPNEFRVKRGLIVEGSGSTIVTIDGASGRLFSVNDSFSGSLFSVNTVAGLPVIEAFSDNTVRIGQFGSQVIFVSQSRVGIGKESALGATLDVSGSSIFTGSLTVAGDNAGFTRIGSAGIGGNLGGIAFNNTAYNIAGQTDGTLVLNYVTGTSLLFRRNNSTVMIIDDNTNVGIGTASPNAKLHVSGSTLITGSLSVSGSVVTQLTPLISTGNFTLPLSSSGRFVEVSSSSTVTVTVPDSSSVNFDVGSQIIIAGYGTGQVQFTTGSNNMFIRSAGARYKLTQQYSTATLLKRTSNEWYLFGDLTP